MDTYELHIPYFKQGDDLAWHREKHTTSQEALAAYSKQMAGVAEIADLLSKEPEVTVADADCHMILLKMPEEVFNRLSKDLPLTEMYDEG